MDLAERLRMAMRHANKSQSQIAREIGKSTAAVSQWMTGAVKGLKADTANALEKATGVRAAWLVTGEGSMLEVGKSNISAAEIGTRHIPLISYVSAGLWTGGFSPFEQSDAHEWLMTDLELSEGAFALEIKGDSMTPDFMAGDRVIIDPSVKPRPGDFVVAKNGEDEATFKKYRLRSIGDDGIEVFELVPLNPDYPSIRSDQVPIRIIGTMVEVRKYRRK